VHFLFYVLSLTVAYFFSLIAGNFLIDNLGGIGLPVRKIAYIKYFALSFISFIPCILFVNKMFEIIYKNKMYYAISIVFNYAICLIFFYD